MYRQYTRKEYKVHSIVFFIFAIFLLPFTLLTLIGMPPLGIFVLLINGVTFWASKRTKKLSKDGFSEEIENFVATSEVKGHIKFNDNTKQVLIDPERNPRIVNYSDILGFELIENGKTIVSKDDTDDFFDRLTNKRESTASINMMRIKIIVKDMNNPNVYIRLIHRETETDSFIYRANFDCAQKILSMLQIATSQIKEATN